MQMDLAYQNYRNTKFFGSLDGLRCLAVLAVIWHHTGSKIEGILLSSQGHFGVDLFFAISGFLITTLLLREKDRFGEISLKKFYIRRSLRIFPLYYSVLLIYIAAVAVIEKGTQAGSEFWTNLPYFATYTSNWFVELNGRVIFYFAWSLAAEEQFYLVWPWIQTWLNGWRPLLAVGVLLLTRLITELLVQNGLVNSTDLYATIIMSIHPAILGGVIAAHPLHNKSTFNLVHPIFVQKIAAPLILGLLLIALSLHTNVWLIWFLMVSLVSSCVISESNGLASFLRLRLVTHIGVISYGAYLMHMLCYNVVKRGLVIFEIDNPVLRFTITSIFVVIVATLSYRYYETIFLKLKERFSTIATRHPAPPSQLKS